MCFQAGCSGEDLTPGIVLRDTGEAELGFHSCGLVYTAFAAPTRYRKNEGEGSQDMSEEKFYTDPDAWICPLHVPHVPPAPQVLGDNTL